MIRSALIRSNSQSLQCSCLIGTQSHYLPLIQASDECRRRRQYTSTNTASSPPRTNDTDAATSSTTNPNISSLCQMNNHPADAPEKTTMQQKQAHKWQMNENPIRSNDGTSSGALAADRLRLARRKAIETMLETFPAAQRTHKVVTSANNLQQHQQQLTDSTIQTINENPIRTNDGTSSGALVADRLQMARRKAIASIKAQRRVPNQHRAKSVSSILNASGLSSKVVLENRDRPNDGTSSGALAADRLRMARRKAIESMNTQQVLVDQHFAINQSDDEESVSSVSANARSSSSKAVHVIENPERSSDGTSSGALAADRLRMARRKAIESLNTQSLTK